MVSCLSPLVYAQRRSFFVCKKIYPDGRDTGCHLSITVMELCHPGGETQGRAGDMSQKKYTEIGEHGEQAIEIRGHFIKEKGLSC